MTSSGYINAIEALEVLGLYNPFGKAKPNPAYLTRLWKKGYLKRYRTGHRTIFYRKVECEALFLKAYNDGFYLTNPPDKLNPNKAA